MTIPAWSVDQQKCLEYAAQNYEFENKLFSSITRSKAWGGSEGRGVKVAIIDSGIDCRHAAVGRTVTGGVLIKPSEENPLVFQAEEEQVVDVYGHGTACAAIIHRAAPKAQLYSCQVLDRNLKAKGEAFAAALRWAIDAGMQVVNLSLGTTRVEHSAALQNLAEEAYFKNIVLVAAANNAEAISYPSQFSAVISVACHQGSNPYEYYYSPNSPIEFGAPGINLRVAWKGGTYIKATGNSFAAPHITGLVSLILAKHPYLSPFQVKTVLRATAGAGTASRRQGFKQLMQQGRDASNAIISISETALSVAPEMAA